MNNKQFENWPDKEIFKKAIWYIDKHVMDVDTWKYTKLKGIHEEIKKSFELLEKEISIISCYISESSWYLFTTRRIVGVFSKVPFNEFIREVDNYICNNFKGHGGQQTEEFTIFFKDKKKIVFEYEAGKASMAPMYIMRFWTLKFPVMFKGFEL